MSNDEKFNALLTYYDLMTMNGSAHIYKCARDFGVIDAFDATGATAEDIADRCGLQETQTRLLLDGLCSIGVLVRDGQSYSLALVTQFLSGNYKNLGDEYWEYLPHFLKTGVPLAKMDSVEHSEEQYEAQVSALAWMMTPAAETLAQMLGMGQARKSLKILDVGAGSAIWSLTCAKYDAETTVTASDWPAIVRIAESFARKMSLQDRFTALPGNYHESNFDDNEYDLAIVANVTHIETPDGNRSLFKKLHAALKPGGEIAIIDVMSDQAEGHAASALYALGLGLRTESGQVHTAEALQENLADAGFSASKLHAIKVAPYTMGAILAEKGGAAC